MPSAEVNRAARLVVFCFPNRGLEDWARRALLKEAEVQTAELEPTSPLKPAPNDVGTITVVLSSPISLCSTVTLCSSLSSHFLFLALLIDDLNHLPRCVSGHF